VTAIPKSIVNSVPDSSSRGAEVLDSSSAAAFRTDVEFRLVPQRRNVIIDFQLLAPCS